MSFVALPASAGAGGYARHQLPGDETRFGRLGSPAGRCLAQSLGAVALGRLQHLLRAARAIDAPGLACEHRDAYGGRRPSASRQHPVPVWTRTIRGPEDLRYRLTRKRWTPVAVGPCSATPSKMTSARAVRSCGVAGMHDDGAADTAPERVKASRSGCIALQGFRRGAGRRRLGASNRESASPLSVRRRATRFRSRRQTHSSGVGKVRQAGSREAMHFEVRLRGAAVDPLPALS